ncbi:MAG: DNA (cytosine-5-)-methyltransferase [Planctomycetes bacterium]|nr:DNA (cytosine-5-)-methyltransferase [Planctomycetota bacterium]
MESCVIEITSAAAKHGNLNIGKCGLSFFPSDVFGGSSRDDYLGVPITIKAKGLKEPIKTDIPTHKINKKPRGIFRERAWVKEFVRANKLIPGDKVTIRHKQNRTYELVPHLRKLTYISLFSNAGIGCYGFKQAGFNCVATNELLEERLSIQKYNDKCKFQSGYICGDITKPEIKNKIFDEISTWRLEEKVKDIDVVIATPPCQGISVANHKKKNEINRNSLIVESLILTREINPKFFIFENVRGFLKAICRDKNGELKPIKDAIEFHLGNYNIIHSVINFLDYGNPSSRTRTLILGVRKDLSEITPLDIFPESEKLPTLRKSIGHFKKLSKMGEIDPDDIFHNFRKYPKHMETWISDLEEGKSAFDQDDARKRPHQICDGKIIPNKNKNGDKYSRCLWNKPGFCIHTRNDQLASQKTIHPEDNRVFSIREVATLMSVPKDFKWASQSLETLNALTYEEKRKFLKKNELNIRRTLGEAVPTRIFEKIANKIRFFVENEKITDKNIEKTIEDNNLQDFSHLLAYLESNIKKYDFSELSKIAELANAKRLHNAAYYTSQDICYNIIKDLPDFTKKREINILEPAVGTGNFLPLLFCKYKNIEKVNLDLVDIDHCSLKLLKLLLRKMKIPNNFKINYINGDFLNGSTCYCKQYDLVIGNPPFKKITKQKELLANYKKGAFNTNTNNLFSFFIEKSLLLGDYVALIVPKSLLSTPEFNKTRELLDRHKLIKISDYGEKAFKIKIETIGIIVKSILNENKGNLVKIESYTLRETRHFPQNHICNSIYPYWLIYRNDFFDKVAKRIIFNIFSVFRDRQITNRLLSNRGKYRVLKSRNVESNRTRKLNGYDCYIDNLDGLSVAKFLNKEKVVMIPNLTYNPRACFLPRNTITDGSVALATPINGYDVSKDELAYYATDEFRAFYKIARNFSTRSMNIDSNAIFFFGIKKASK